MIRCIDGRTAKISYGASVDDGQTGESPAKDLPRVGSSDFPPFFDSPAKSLPRAHKDT